MKHTAARLVYVGLAAFTVKAVRVDEDTDEAHLAQGSKPSYPGDHDEKRLEKAAARAAAAEKRNWSNFTGWSDGNNSTGTDPNEPVFSGGFFDSRTGGDGVRSRPQGYRRRRWPGGGVDYKVEPKSEDVEANEVTSTAPPWVANGSRMETDPFPLRRYDAIDAMPLSTDRKDPTGVTNRDTGAPAKTEKAMQENAALLQGENDDGGGGSPSVSDGLIATAGGGPPKTDADSGEQVSKLSKAIFATADTNGDGALDQQELQPFKTGGAQAGEFTADGKLPPLVRSTLGSEDLMRRFDKNRDGKLVPSELDGVLQATHSAMNIPAKLKSEPPTVNPCLSQEDPTDDSPISEDLSGPDAPAPLDADESAGLLQEAGGADAAAPEEPHVQAAHAPALSLVDGE